MSDPRHEMDEVLQATAPRGVGRDTPPGRESNPNAAAHGLEVRMDNHARDTAAYSKAILKRIDDMAAAQETRLGRIEGRLGEVEMLAGMSFALAQGIAAKVGVDATEREGLIKAEREQRARNAVVDRDAASQRGRLDQLARDLAAVRGISSDVEGLKEDIDELSASQQRAAVSIDKASETLAGMGSAIVTEAFRAKVASIADDEREARAMARSERTHDREERSKLRWWLLGLLGTVILAATSAAIGRLTGHAPDLHLPAAAEPHKE